MKKHTLLRVLAGLSCAATLFTAASCSCSNPNKPSSNNPSSNNPSSSQPSELKTFAENVDFKDASVVYTGSAQSLTVENLPAGAKVTYSTEQSYTNVGTYEIKATVSLDGYKTKEIVGQLTITKANFDLSSYKLENVSVTYDGTKKELAPTGTLPEGVTATIKYYSDAACTTEVEPIDAGTYYALVKFTHTSTNHNAIEDVKKTVIINKAQYALTDVEFEAVTETYTGSAIEAELTGTLPEGVTATIKYYSDEACTTEVQPIEVGTYYAQATFASTNSNYKTIDPIKTTVEINKILVTAPTAATNLTYTGSSLTGVASGDLYDVTGGTNTNAGSYEATVTLKDTAHYEWENVNFNGKVAYSISKAKVDLPEANTNLVYTGSAITGVTGNDLYTVADGSATNAGTHVALATLKDTTNYEWATSSFNGEISYTISKANIDVSGVVCDELTLVASGDNVNYVAKNIPTNVNATIKYYSDEACTTEVSSTKEVGKYYCVVSYAPKDTVNYNEITTTHTGVLNVIENNTGIVFANKTVTYNGENHSIAVDTTNAAEEGNFSVSYYKDLECTIPYTEEVSHKNAGEYTVYAKVTDANELFPESVISAKLTINKKEVVVTISDKECEYSTTLNEVKGTFSLESVEGFIVESDADLVDVSKFAFSTNYTGTSSVGTYEIDASGLEAENYSFTYVKGTLTVNRKELATPEVLTNLSYDKTAKEGVVANPDLYIVTYEEGDAITAGTHEATVTLKDPTNYKWAGSNERAITVEFEIQKATYIPPSDKVVFKQGSYNSVMYNGEEIQSTVALPYSTISSLNGTIVSFYEDEEGTVALDSVIDAGTYYAKVRFTHEDSNYNPVPDTIYEFVVNKRYIEISWQTQVQYNGKQQSPASILKGIQGNDDVSINCFPVNSDGKTISTHKFDVSLVGSDSHNYCLHPNYTQGEINIIAPKGVFVSNGEYSLTASKDGKTYFAQTKIDTNADKTSSYIVAEAVDSASAKKWSLVKVEGKQNTYYLKTNDQYLTYTSETKVSLSDSPYEWILKTNNTSYYFAASTPDGEGVERYLGLYKRYTRFAAYSIEDFNTYPAVTLHGVTSGDESPKAIFVSTTVAGGSVTYTSTAADLNYMFSCDTITLTLTPDSGNMVSWVKIGSTEYPCVENSDGTATCIIPAESSGTIEVAFETAKTKYNVSLENNTNVDISESLLSSYYETRKVEFEASGKSGYRLNSVTVTDTDGTPIELTIDGDTYSFIMPNKDVKISFDVDKVYTISHSATPGFNYIVEADGELASESIFKEGTVITIKDSLTNPGYSIDKILVNGQVDEDGLFTLKSDVNIEITTKELIPEDISTIISTTTSDTPVLVEGSLSTIGASNTNYATKIADESNTISVYKFINTDEFKKVSSLSVGDKVMLYGNYYISGDYHNLSSVHVIDFLKTAEDFTYRGTYLQWNEAVGAVSYDVYLGSEKLATVEEPELNLANYTDKVVSGNTYSWYVVAHSEKGLTSTSETVSLAYADKYAINLQVENATVAFFDQNGNPLDYSAVSSGTTVYFTITPNQGYTLSRVENAVTINGLTLSSDEITGKYSFVVSSTNNLSISIVESTPIVEEVINFNYNSFEKAPGKTSTGYVDYTDTNYVRKILNSKNEEIATYSSSDARKYSSSFAFKASTGYIIFKASNGGTITSITLTYKTNTTARGNVSAGVSESNLSIQVTPGTESNNKITYSFESGANYVKISSGSSAINITDITLTYLPS